MKRVFFLYLFVHISGWAMSQDIELVATTSNENLTKKVSNNMQYLLPDFVDGTVYYLNTQTGKGKMNYNTVLGEMQFMTSDQQVMSLDNVSGVKEVIIGDRKFYPVKGDEFAEVLDYGNIQLLVKKKCQFTPHGKKTAYGGYSATSSITNYSGTNSSTRYLDLSTDELVMAKVDIVYYLISNNKRTAVKSMQVIYKQFPKNKVEIEKFVKANNIKLTDEDGMKSLVKYCSTL